MSQIIRIQGREICVSRSTIPPCVDITLTGRDLPAFQATVYLAQFDNAQEYEATISRTITAAQAMLAALPTPEARAQ